MPVRNRLKSFKQKGRTVLARIRGKDPVTYRRGQIFAAKRTLSQRIRKLKTVSRVKTRMAIGRMLGSPVDYMWNPTPRAKPKIVRRIQARIIRETELRLSFDPNVKRIGIRYLEMEKQLNHLEPFIHAFHEKQPPNRIIVVEELSKKDRELLWNHRVVYGKWQHANEDLQRLFFAEVSRNTTSHAVKWTLNQMGVSRAHQMEITVALTNVLQAVQEAHIPTDTLSIALGRIFPKKKMIAEFLRTYDTTHQKIAMDPHGIPFERVKKRLLAHLE